MPLKIPPDILRDVSKTVALKARIKALLQAEVGDYHESGRLSYLLMELGIEAFRKAGVPPFLVTALTSMICHGSSAEKALEALMVLQHDQNKAEAVTTGNPDYTVN